MNIKKVLQRGVLLLALVLLSGCVIVENLKLMIEGYDRYRSSATALVYKMDNTAYYNSAVNYDVLLDRKGRYISHLINMGSFSVGFPTTYIENYDKTIQKLTMFVNWANEPYEQRIKNMAQVQNTLPNNDPKAAKGITDFYLFMSPDVNDNTPYLAYNRDVSYTTEAKILMNKDNVIVIIAELKAWKDNIENQK